MDTTIIIRTESENKEIEFALDFEDWKRMRIKLPISKIASGQRKALKEAEEVSDEV